MKRRKAKSAGGPISIEVDSTLHLGQFDGWQLLSYDTDPAAGFLFRDAGQPRDRLEIFYWQQEGEQHKPQFVLEAETGNIGIGASIPTDKLTLRGGALAFQQAEQDQSEMGIDYDAASQSLRIRAHTDAATGLDKDVLTINKNGEITAQGNFNAQGSLAVAGSLAAQSINATESLRAKTIIASAEVSVGNAKMTGDTVSAPKLTASAEVNVGNTKMTAGSVSAIKLTASQEISVGDTKLTIERVAAPKLTASTEVSVGSTKMSGDTVSAPKLTASTEVSVGTTKLTSDTVAAQKLIASAEVKVGNTVLTTEGVSGKTLSATTEIKASNVQGTGTGGSLTLSGGQGVLFLMGKTVTIGTEMSDAFVMGNLIMDGNKKILLKGTDDNHGIRYGGSVKFADQVVDGPVVFGYGGGALGVRDRNKETKKEMIALGWTQEGNIGIGTLNPGGMLELRTRSTEARSTNAVVKFGGKNGDVHHFSSARDFVFNSLLGIFAFRKLNDFNDLNTHEEDLVHIGPTGDLTVRGDVRSKGKLLSASSRELKENISALTVDEAMATLQALQPVKYDYRGAHAFRQTLGFIAEEMPDNLASEDRKFISPFEVIPILTRVVKEQQQTITALQETVRALQADVQQSDRAMLNG